MPSLSDPGKQSQPGANPQGSQPAAPTPSSAGPIHPRAHPIEAPRPAKMTPDRIALVVAILLLAIAIAIAAVVLSKAL